MRTVCTCSIRRYDITFSCTNAPPPNRPTLTTRVMTANDYLRFDTLVQLAHRKNHVAAPRNGIALPYASEGKRHVP